MSINMLDEFFGLVPGVDNDNEHVFLPFQTLFSIQTALPLK